MLIASKHRVAMIEILRDIYTDPELRTAIGFKGGTAAMLYYDLPRLSVDLDFDLLDESKKDFVFEKVKMIVKKIGRVDEAIEKKYTLFFVVSYEKGEHNIKVEISKRKSGAKYAPKNYMGVNMLVMVMEDMFAGKLAALIQRNVLASRDVFDVNYFLKNKWEINEKSLQDQTGMSLEEVCNKAIKVVEGLTATRLLYGLGELIDNKQKTWVKEKMKEETIFYLRLMLG